MSAGNGSSPRDAGVKLKIDHLGKTYERDGKSLSVLEDINLEVGDGEFICLVGPSGCGKSTLLNLMGGFLSPTSGSVTIDGNIVSGPDPSTHPGLPGARCISMADG